MKVVLCALASQYVHSTLAVWYLKASVEAYGLQDMEIAIVEGSINEPDAAVLARIMAEQPDVVAFSCYIWNHMMVCRLVPALALYGKDIRIILGGPEVSYNGPEVLRALAGVDYIVSGEGEIPFPKLLQALQNQETVECVPGLCFRDPEGLIHQNSNDAFLAEPPSPYSKRYLQALQGRIAYLETQRGCPFSCSFCLSGKAGGVRWFSLERAKETLVLLANSGTRTVKLVDRTFNCNPRRAYEIFRFLIEEAGRSIPAAVCFHFEIAADLLNEPTLRLLEKAPKGLIQFEAGLQSFHAPTLEAVRRKTDLHKLACNIKALLRTGNIHLHIDLIAGLPFEDIERFAHSFNQAYALEPHTLQLGFLKLLHGAALRTQAAQWDYRYNERPPYTVEANHWLSPEDIARLVQMEDALERLYNSGRFRLTLAYLLEVTEKTPFALLDAFGAYVERLHDTAGISLRDYTTIVWDYFTALPRVDRARLRDVMVCDCLCSNNTGKLPPCLQIPDARLKWIRKALARKGIRQGIANLYAQETKVVVADYTTKDPVTGWYPYRVIDMPDREGE